MFLTPYTSLNWVYQLHYYLGFRTYRRRPLFEEINRTIIEQALTEICGRHDYHLLKSQIYADQLRCVLSLQPQQAVARTVQTIKANATRICREKSLLRDEVWARGYLALSTGRMQIAAVRQYLDSQAKHHGYATRLLPPVFGYRTTQPINLSTAHSKCDLNYHLVFATWERRGVFTAGLGERLVQYWLRVAAKHSFAIDQVSVVPDHVHLLVRLPPMMTVEDCGLALLSNSQHFIGQRYGEMLIQAKVPRLWQPSGYAGTCGEVTTALVKTWLDS